MNGLARAVAEDFAALLDVDVAIVGFHGVDTALAPAGLVCLPDGLIEQAMATTEVTLCSATPGDPTIFGDGAGLVRSFALVRLNAGGCPPGLLALGSRHERAFQSTQGTELLTFLARVIENCVERWWPAA
jgi:hypothetical protein